MTLQPTGAFGYLATLDEGEIPMEVRASYPLNGPDMDKAAFAAAGRLPNFSGAGFGARDLGWVCKSEDEAERIAQALRGIGLEVMIHRSGSWTEPLSAQSKH